MNRRWIRRAGSFAGAITIAVGGLAFPAVAAGTTVSPRAAAACWQRNFSDTRGDATPDVIAYSLAFDCATARFAFQFSLDPHAPGFGVGGSDDRLRLWIATGSSAGCNGFDRVVVGTFTIDSAEATVFDAPTCSPTTWTVAGAAVFQPLDPVTFRMSFPVAALGTATFGWWAETPQPAALVRDRFPDAGALAATGVPYHPTATSGYWLTDADGGVHPYGNAAFFGDLAGIELAAPIVDMAAPAARDGYWLLASDGGVFAFGAAGFYGSTGALHLNEPVEGMTATTTGHGYWFVASDGGIFSYGDAPFYGSTGALHLNRPIVGMAATPSGHGYWLVAGDGGIFSFGDAAFYGSTGALQLNKAIVGMAPTPSGHGYWLVASDGGIFSFGDAAFYGSTGALHLDKRIEAMTASPTGHGYRFVASDGGIFCFGDAPFWGSLAGTPAPMVVALD